MLLVVGCTANKEELDKEYWKGHDEGYKLGQVLTDEYDEIYNEGFDAGFEYAELVAEDCEEYDGTDLFYIDFEKMKIDVERWAASECKKWEWDCTEEELNNIVIGDEYSFSLNLPFHAAYPFNKLCLAMEYPYNIRIWDIGYYLHNVSKYIYVRC